MIKISLKDEERIKRVLSDFFAEEYGCTCNKLTSVISMAFTLIDRLPVQVNLLPFELKLVTYVDEKLVEEYHYDNVEEMISELETYDFDMLVNV